MKVVPWNDSTVDYSTPFSTTVYIVSVVSAAAVAAAGGIAAAAERVVL